MYDATTWSYSTETRKTYLVWNDRVSGQFHGISSLNWIILKKKRNIEKYFLMSNSQI